VIANTALTNQRTAARLSAGRVGRISGHGRGLAACHRCSVLPSHAVKFPSAGKQQRHDQDAPASCDYKLVEHLPEATGCLVRRTRTQRAENLRAESFHLRELPPKKQEIAKPVEKPKQEPKRVHSQERPAKPETREAEGLKSPLCRFPIRAIRASFAR
jgi:hypothetical protein